MGVVRRMSVLALVVGVTSCGGVTGTTNTSTTTVDALSCATDGTCVVGDAGPGGGIVFYDAGSTQSWGRYLEATPGGWSSANSGPRAEWGCRRTSISGARGTAIGTGQVNTTAIVAGCTVSGIAAQLALIYANRAIIGGFAADTYWSSSEHNAGGAWLQYFYDGHQEINYKGSPLSVRPVRAFG